MELLRIAVEEFDNVEICSFSGLLVDFMRKIDSRVVIKGIRAVSDFEYEFQMALTNKALYPDVETFFLHTNQEYMFLSSSIVKEIASYHGDLHSFVSENVEKKLREKFQ